MGASIYFSSGSYAAPTLAQALAECEAEGLGGMELSSGLSPSPTHLAEARAAATRGLPLLVHNYFPPPAEPFVLNLASTDAHTLTRSLQMCRENIALAREVGAGFYSVHSGFAMNLTAEQLGQPEVQAALEGSRHIDRNTAERTFAENVATLAAEAQAQGIGLLLENNVLTATQAAAGRAKSLLMTTPQEVHEFLEAHPGVQFLLDVGHAKVAAGALGFAPEEFFTLVGPHIGALHLSDNDGLRDTNGPIRPDSWFLPYLPAFAHLPMVIEVYRLSAEARAAQHGVLTAALA